MTEVIIYSTDYCPYCVKAKGVIERKGHTYTEIDVTNDDDLRLEMMQKSGGRRTVPQIFINGTHVGGSDDLDKLNASGGLDELLAG